MPPETLNPPFVLLDDSRDAGCAGRSMLFYDPDHIICARTHADVPHALAQLDQAVADGFHVAGWIAYEAAAAWEDRVKNAVQHWPKEPLIWMLATRNRTDMEPATVDAWLSSRAFESEQHDETHAHLSFTDDGPEYDTYADHLDRIQRYILAGDIYQANYTFPRPCKLVGEPLAIYRQLRREQPVEYGAFIHTGEDTVLSFSPELFVQRRGCRLQARPMKGTANRYRNVVEDREAAIALSADPKSQAENLMIVDLIRNDLSRVATKGTVSVSDLFTIETYPTLHQMTSGIEAACDPSLKPTDLLEALFPCGSVTGAPKIRAMQVIAELEQAPRGVYCGAIGHFSPTADDKPTRWSLSVPIRTFIFDDQGTGRLAVGSGIVADSEVAAEYRECNLKATFAEKVATPPFHLIETMRLEKGAIRLLDRHLDRLSASARYFGIPLDGAAIQRDIAGAVAKTSPGIFRVRLVVDQAGQPTVDITPHDEPEGDGLTVAFAAPRLNSGDVWLRHKTSNRALYDAATSIAKERGLADLVFQNERGELVEGAISTVFLDTGKGWLTPPLASGALPGVLRAELMDDPAYAMKEQVLTPEDLARGWTVYLGNALRGLRRVDVRPDIISLL